MPRQSGVDIVRQKMQENPLYEEFMQVLAKTDKKKPKAEDVEALQRILGAHPELWRMVGDLAHLARMDLIDQMSGTPAVEELLKTGVSKMLAAFGWSQSPPLEQAIFSNRFQKRQFWQLDVYYYQYRVQYVPAVPYNYYSWTVEYP